MFIDMKKVKDLFLMHEHKFVCKFYDIKKYAIETFMPN